MDALNYRTIAELKRQEAQCLLNSGLFSGSYYLAGTAFECALKAIIAKKLRTSGQVPHKRFCDDFYCHEIPRLVKLAGLEPALKEQRERTQFDENWNTITVWRVDDRYTHSIAEPRAVDFYQALVDKNDGVLPWLESYYNNDVPEGLGQSTD